jgi:hypothetical protein
MFGIATRSQHTLLLLLGIARGLQFLRSSMDGVFLSHKLQKKKKKISKWMAETNPREGQPLFHP